MDFKTKKLNFENHYYKNLDNSSLKIKENKSEDYTNFIDRDENGEVDEQSIPNFYNEIKQFDGSELAAFESNTLPINAIKNHKKNKKFKKNKKLKMLKKVMDLDFLKNLIYILGPRWENLNQKNMKLEYIVAKMKL